MTNGGKNGKREEPGNGPGVPKTPGPMSTDDWEKELDEMKGKSGSGPEIPNKAVRLPTPPPGGFVAPPLQKPAQKPSKPPTPPRQAPVIPPRTPQPGRKPQAPATGVRPAPPAASRAAAESRGVTAKQVSRALEKTGLRTAGAAKPLARPGSKKKATKVSIFISVVLFVVTCLSVAAGYHYRARSGIDYYMEMLRSEDPAREAYAREALRAIGAPAVPELAKMTASGNEREVLAAVNTLALIECDLSAETLMKLTGHENVLVARRAIIALGAFALDQSFPCVCEHVSSPDHETRLCAIGALKDFDPQKAVPVLLELLDDSDWRVRNVAAKTLRLATGQQLSVPTSTTSPETLETIRRQWRQWWEENKVGFKRPSADDAR
jgi:hypothetical protein